MPATQTLSRDIGPEGNNVNCRNVIIIARYLRKTIGTESTLFDDLPYTREFLLDEIHWIPLKVYTTIIKRTQTILNDPNASYNIGLSAAKLGSWGESFAALQKLFAGVFFTPRAGYRRLPEFVKHFNHTKDFEIVYIEEGLCLLKVTFKKHIDPVDDYESDFFIRGILAGLPETWRLPHATVTPMVLQYHLPRLLDREFSHVPFECTLDQNGLVINGQNHGRWVTKDGYKSLLITKNLLCNQHIVAREGELFHAPFFLYKIEWKRQNWFEKINRLGSQLLSRRRYIEHADHQLSIIRRYAEGLEKIVEERTHDLAAAKEEVENWKTKAEKLLYGLLPEDIAEEMVHKTLEPRRIVATTMITDLAGFTNYSKDRSPEDIATRLNQYFDRIKDVTLAHNGWILKFRGDGILAVFGIDEKPGHELRAARAAVEMQKMIKEYPWDLRIGIDSGEMVVGEIGSGNLRRLDCTGHTLNLAARLEGAAENGQILVSEELAGKIKNDFQLESAGSAKLKGIGDVQTYHIVTDYPS